MFDSTLYSIISFFNKRFIITIFLPCLIISLFFLSLVIYVNGTEYSIKIWSNQKIEVQFFFVIGYICMIYFYAYILLIFLKNVTQFYEGYWDNFFGINTYSNMKKKYFLKRFARMHQFLDIENNRDTQTAQNYFRSFYSDYPYNIKDIMPTRLGNILKNSEVYSLDRYGLDSVLLFSRLYPLLPQTLRDNISEYKSVLDSMITISFLSITFSVISLLYMLIIHVSLLFLITVFISGLIIGYIAYLGAINAAYGYSDTIKSAYDLYRMKLLTTLGYKLPKSCDEEKIYWSKICQFLYYDSQNNELKGDVPYSNFNDYTNLKYEDEYL